ncbi:MAG: hypothetical protein AVDCRST_MAG70-1252 [uncultured Thermomicrobiales bacterium]|uniref:Uncharacterized protein n=1 Tax=uncultured Thermomicrobiales bacterium TaxID=1645740 RepID=A0A6J4UT28_9BACT|nr:MAG: hypothetical protein AVDCRST_MAG70-1252 [uncultured Thermomicrobiales bacterium]
MSELLTRRRFPEEITKATPIGGSHLWRAPRRDEPLAEVLAKPDTFSDYHHVDLDERDMTRSNIAVVRLPVTRTARSSRHRARR